MENRIRTLEERDLKYKELKSKENLKITNFIQLGQQIAKTQEGKKFFSLAKDIFYKANEKMRDNFLNNDPLILARLNGEDFILRKVVLQFINNNIED